ncbi:MAG: hypothetical protein IKT98_10410 [Selenomonadaceae bacterium]|nr:hypothetical protein [Selenomonadaceae bacterium]
MVKMRLTQKGALLLAKAISGRQLTFTHGEFGSGIADMTPQELDARTQLINKRMELDIVDFQTYDNGDIVVSFSVSNATVTEGYRISECGLFARIDDEPEVLYAYSYEGEQGDWMHAGTDDIVLQFIYEVITTISNAANVTAVIRIMNEAGRGLTRTGQTLNVNIANNTLLGGIKVGKNLYMKEESLNASLNVANNTLLGGIKVGKNLYMEGESLNAEASESDPVEERLRQLEINLANVYIYLDADNKLGKTANLYLSEDLTDPEACGLTEITTKTAHAKSITAADISGVRNGGYYTISGIYGIHNKEVQIVAVKKEGDTYELTTDANITYNYSHPPILYRSTAYVKDGKAYGAGLSLTRRHRHTYKWRGEGINNQMTLALNTSNANASNFSLEGDWAFTDDGFFTLE